MCGHFSSMMGKVAIVKAGATMEKLRRSEGDFDEWIMHKSGFAKDAFMVLDVHKTGEWPKPDQFKAVIITGSHANVTENSPWQSLVVDYLQKVRNFKIPILGICFGHHLLAVAFGGQVAENPKGKEFGVVSFRLSGDGQRNPLFVKFSNKFPVFMSHAQTIIRLPQKAKNLGTTSLDKYGAFFLEPSVWGVQFHPEFNREIMTVYLEEYFNVRKAEIENYLHEAENAPNIIKRFLELAFK